VSPTARFAIRLAAGIGLLALVLSRVDWTGFAVGGGSALAAIGIGAVLLLASQAVAAFRWRLILGDAELPWSYLVRLYVIASFFSLLLPTAVGGDAARAAAAARAARRPGGAVASVLVDRMLGVVALLVYALIGLLLARGTPPLLFEAVALRIRPATLGLALAILALAGLVVVGLARRSARLAGLLRDGRSLLSALARDPRTLVTALALALVVQGLILAIWWCLAQGLDLAIPLTTILVAVPVVTLGTMLPITLAGLGVREGIWLLLLEGSGVPPSRVVAMSIGYFGSALLVGAVGLALFVGRGIEPARPGSAAAGGQS